MYQHDPAHHAAGTCSGISASTVSLLHPGWFVQTPAAVTASPTIATVDGVQQVYEGDNGGNFYDINASTGRVLHTFSVKNDASQKTPSQCTPGATSLTDGHQTSYGAFTSSAAVATVPDGDSPRTLVFVGANGSLLALDAKTLTCAWSVDLDPARPTSAMESESSPVVYKKSNGMTEVIVGSDSNEGPGSSAPSGVQAFKAATGELLWKYEPENNQTDTTLINHSDTNGCGDVWSSPALDPNGLGKGHGLIIATTGNCPNGSAKPGTAAAPSADCDYSPAPPQIEGMAGIDANNGCLVWRWSEPSNQYANPDFSDGGDTDIGSSPILTTVGSTPAVIDGGKSGYMYALNEATGETIWARQIAEPGEVGAFGGGIGGFIGSSALGQSSPQGGLTGAAARPTIFGTTAILAPFENTTSGVAPDSTLAKDPTRTASLHAIDVGTGDETWHATISVPSYAATTYVNGVVFAPSTIGFDIVAYDADTGTPLWAFPLAASLSSGATVAGSSIFFGAGTTEDPLPPNTPPQVNGIWSFTTAPGVPSVTPTAPAVPLAIP
jgi:outer membrane protein assembly factor BamB